MENVPRKGYIFQDINANSVKTTEGNIIVRGTGPLDLESTPSGGKALVVSGGQYLSKRDFTDACFGDVDRSPLGLTIKLSLKLTNSTDTCYGLSNGRQSPSHYGYAL